jgi:hypothetical protein
MRPGERIAAVKTEKNLHFSRSKKAPWLQNSYLLSFLVRSLTAIISANNANLFLIDETEDEVADGGEFTIPDAALFNDSLDEGVDPTALLDNADLPIESAAAEPKPENLELNDSLNSADDLDETQLPASDDTPTQAVVEMEPATLGVAKTKIVTPPRAATDPGNDKLSKASPREVSSPSAEKKTKAESCKEKIVAGSTPTVESQASKGVAKVKPSFGKKKKGFTPPKVTAKTATTAPSQSDNKQLPKKTSDQSSSNASEKSPPQVSSPEVGADSPKQQPHSNVGSDVKTTSEKVPSTETKKVKVTDKKVTTEEKKKEKEKKEQERALKKQGAEQKRLEREKKKAELERQRNEKKLELERKKAEREQKKMEKELKKIEREQKKAEKQAKASQKQLTKDKKTEETSSSEESEKKDKVEPSSEKVTEEKSQQENEGDKTGTVMKPGEQALESNIEEKENTPPNKEQSCKVSTTDAAATLSPNASHGDKSKIQKATLEKRDDQQNTSEADIKEKELVEAGSSDDASEREKLAKDTTAAANSRNGEENTISTPEKGGDEQNICDSVIEEEGKISPKEKESGSSEASEQHEEELNKNGTTAASPLVSKSAKVSKDGTTKQKEKKVKKFSPPKKAKKDASKAAGKETKKQRKAVIKMDRVGCVSGAGDGGKQKTKVGGKGKKRKPSVYSDSEDELEPKRAKSAENVGSVWVQCENANCKKWRLLKDCDDPSKVPGKWVCSMNTDADRNSCSAEEERWSDLGDSQEFVESPFIPGSLVWSKMEGYPW